MQGRDTKLGARVGMDWGEVMARSFHILTRHWGIYRACWVLSLAIITDASRYHRLTGQLYTGAAAVWTYTYCGKVPYIGVKVINGYV